MLRYNEPFMVDEEFFMYVEDTESMFDLDDYMHGFHRVAISLSNETVDGKKVIKVCFGDLLDMNKLKNALNEYFSQ